MRKKERLVLINELVDNAYDPERYLEFIREILGGGDLDLGSEYMGEVCVEGERIGVFQVECSEVEDFYKSRRTQRNYVGELLKEEAYSHYKKVLTAFYSAKERIWRLSLIEVDKTCKDLGIKPLKMLSHIMGLEGKNRAAYEMISLLIEKKKKKGVKGICIAFNQEKLLEGFFKRYSERFFKLKEELLLNDELKRIAENHGYDIEEISDTITRRVSTRLIILYFLQKKGWLGAPKEGALEDGDKNFIENFRSRCHKKCENFYRDCLIPLLVKGINNPNNGGERYIEELGFKMPYFDNYFFRSYLNINWERKKPVVENGFFYGGDQGMIDLFHMYHFSLIENEPFLQDMVVDPEMVGKIFENLMDTENRRSKGTYYTPREVVHFMCKETLANFIYNNIGGFDEKEIKDFVFYGEFFWNEDKMRSKRGEKGYKINKRILENLGKIDILLRRVRVVEPSSGSGAFLLGMMGELLKLRKIIEKYMKFIIEPHISERESGLLENFHIKKEIIRNNLYGVDIDSTAVETAKIRMWLSLLADARRYDYDTLSKPEGNIVNGNSITMEWREAFEDVFKAGGFDIVIGNPPYVGEKGNKDIFREIAKSSLGKRYYQGRGDLFYFFFHLGLDILRSRGTLAFITTNYFLTADGALKLREDLRERSNILEMIDFNEISVFSKAKGQHNIITIIEKSERKDREGRTSLCNIRGEITSGEMRSYLERKYEKGSYFVLSQKDFFQGEKSYIRLEKSRVSEILDKVAEQSIKLGSVMKVNQGIVSGADKVTRKHIESFGIKGEKGDGIFVLTRKEREKLNLEEREKRMLGMFFKNSNIGRYVSDKVSDNCIIYITKGDLLESYPEIERHLTRYKAVLENKREARLGRLPWYSLHWSREKDIFTGEKIVAPQRSRKNLFAYNAGEWYASADVYYITKIVGGSICLKYILSLLNSKLYYMWLYNRGKRKGELLELYATPLEEIPIKKIPKKEQKKFIEAVERIIRGIDEGQDTSSTERKIDQMVYELYGLSLEECNEVEEFYRSKMEESG